MKNLKSIFNAEKNAGDQESDGTSNESENIRPAFQ